jgi:hypothetical protein
MGSVQVVHQSFQEFGGKGLKKVIIIRFFSTLRFAYVLSRNLYKS